MRRLKLVKDETSIDFLTWRDLAVKISAGLVVLSLVSLVAFGLNFGIDFRGGALVQVKTEGPADISAIRSTVGDLGLGDTAIQEFGAEDRVMIRIERQPGEGDAQVAAVNLVAESVLETFPGSEILGSEVVGPKVSGELVQSGVLAIVVAVLVVLFYIWIRFEWQFSVGAVVALVHDVILTIGVFAIFQIEFTLAIIAAILTIVGYSLNDTVVVYDRVRENLRRYKTTSLLDVLNLSINETLSRTLMTSLTTLLALLALFIVAYTLRGFTFALIWGVLIGTYSSVFIAAPVLHWLGVKRNWDEEDSAPSAGAGVQFGGEKGE